VFSITGCLIGLFTAILLAPQLAAGQDEKPPAAEANAPVRISPEDPIRDIQAAAVASKQSDIAYWGTDPLQYSNHTSHSNRLIPVYTFGTKGAGAGIDLDSWFGTQSVYRSADALQKIYGYLPERTVNPSAIWMDQTNVFDIQSAAASAGKKYIFLVVFDGMDWQTTHAAAIWNSANLNYKYGRGSGNHFQSYTAAGTTQFGYFVTSPHNEGTDVDVDAQTVLNPGGTMRGGYDASVAGIAPWSVPVDPGYMISKGAAGSPKHAYTDSSSSASSMTAGIKTFNGAINVDPSGQPVPTIAHMLQSRGWKVGAVSSVPISHATPACTYAHNVARDDYQDLTRDMLGLASIAHPSEPLPGMDVVIGGGYGVTASQKDGIKKQGKNFVEGPSYLTEADLQAVDVQNGGRYVTSVRTAGRDGTDVLNAAAGAAAKGGQRLLGFFGNGHTGGHLPFTTASGFGQPAPGIGGKSEVYTDADLLENPTLAEMTVAALEVLGQGDNSFWLMVEAGDVDWANHDNNLDNSIGAVNSGDAAVRAITDWVELNSNWNESLLIVTADHGHMLNIVAPQKIADQAVRFQNFEKRRLAKEKQQAAQREQAAEQAKKAEDAKKANDAKGENSKGQKKPDPPK
jgi:alkaline phosphatase